MLTGLNGPELPGLWAGLQAHAERPERAGLNTVKLNHAIICPKPRTSMAEPNTNLHPVLSAAPYSHLPHFP